MTRAVQTALAGAGGVLQVVSANQGTPNASTSSPTWTDVLTVTITPTSATSKIAVLANAWSGCTRNGDQLYVAGRIVRRVGGTDTIITIGNDMMGDEWCNHYRYTPNTATSVITYRMVFNQIDSPATTGAVTYVWQHAALGSVATNQTSGVEFILMEIAGVNHGSTQVGSGMVAAGAVSQSSLGTGVAGNGPAFSAYLTTNQSVTSDVNTKIACNSKEFDTANCYDATTNYRFTPNVAGYYQVNGHLSCRFASGVSRFMVQLWKNGSIIKYGGDINYASGIGFKVTLSSLVYMNGTTDYLELYGSVAASTAQFSAESGQSTYFQAYLARAA